MPSLDSLRAALADRYRLDRELGQGGMATVYRAHDLKHDRDVALKVLKPELAAVLGAERFVQEIKTTAQLQHPHILPLFDSGTADGFLYYVMPYIEGETLRHKLDRETQLGIDEAVKITTEVADALDYAHRHGVIHRDIKPENILLHDGRPMVADFGIALALSAAAGGRLTETGLSLGTPHYMSPEQATADKDITNRSDIYSLGSVLYEMLTGNPPHTGSSAQQIIMKIIAEPVPPVTTLRKSVPPNVAAAVTKALEKLPADRFESAKAFADALHNPAFATTTVSIAGPVTGRPWLADRRTWAALAVATTSLAAALLLLVNSGANGPDLSRMSAEQKTFTKQTIVNARWAPDGKTIVYSAAPRLGAVPRLYIIRPDYPEPAPLGLDSTHLLAVSSTGELAVLTHARQIGTWRAFSGTLARMPIGGSPRDIIADVREADWSPDGSQLAITRFVGDTMQLEYPAGRVLYRTTTGYLSDVRISPVGDRIGFIFHDLRGDNRGTVMLVDARGRSRTLTPECPGMEGLAWERGGQSVLFSCSGPGGMFEVHRADLRGQEQLAVPSAGSLWLLDVSREGRWLVARADLSLRIFVHQAATSGLKDVSWLGFSYLYEISRDGTLLAIGDQGRGVNYSIMIRKTDGTPAIRVGDGDPRGISPDRRWIIGMLPTATHKWWLYPIGAGDPRELHWNGLESVSWVAWFPDGHALLVCGSEPHRVDRCYRSPLDGSSLDPVTPDSVGFGMPRPDGQAVLYASPSGEQWIHLLSGGPDRPVPDTRDVPIYRWSPDGSALWVKGGTDETPRVDRLDTATGRRTPLVTIERPPGESDRIVHVVLADNPHTYAYLTFVSGTLLFTMGAAR